ncbi:MAG: peptidylprolyl isomerase [Sphingomonadales bacterium]|nr:peptidylprolyl isomerase [Sphingomonadales bacterium]
MKLFKRLSFAAVLISATALTPLNAQSTPDSEGNDANLIAADGQQLFGKNDPNVRRATAQVNGEIITGTDMDHRLALIVAANENKLPPEELARFRAQILTNLIDETLQIQEAVANKIEVTDAEVDQYFDRVAQQNFKRPANQVEKYLTSIGASVATPTEYRLGEIYLSATPEAMPAVTENAKKIIDQLRQGANFVAYARQFSEASTASVGGDLGWLSLAQLPSSLATAAAGMNSNEVQAVASPGGISILLLIDKRQVAMSDPRDSVLSLKQIAITFPAGTAEAQIAPLVKRFSEETQQIAGCGVADEMAAKLGADVVNRDGIKIRDLPAPLQQVMLDLQIGQSTPPYGSLQDGVRVFVLCGRDAPEVAASESFDEIMSRLEEERVNKRARIYLRDLRRDAVIEYN